MAYMDLKIEMLEETQIVRLEGNNTYLNQMLQEIEKNQNFMKSLGVKCNYEILCTLKYNTDFFKKFIK